MIFESIDRPEAALRAYDKALAIHPHAQAAVQGKSVSTAPSTAARSRRRSSNSQAHARGIAALRRPRRWMSSGRPGIGWLRNASWRSHMDDGASAAALTQAAKDKLRQTVSKIEKLEEEKKEVGGQIKDVYQEAKSMGYDTKALRTVIRLRKLDRQEREEQEAILDTYLLALGEISGSEI